jgi:hypothetical protein
MKSRIIYWQEVKQEIELLWQIYNE